MIESYGLYRQSVQERVLTKNDEQIVETFAKFFS